MSHGRDANVFGSATDADGERENRNRLGVREHE